MHDAEPLVARVIEADAGASDTTILLLHGIVSTQAQFDATWDELSVSGMIVMPDMLGFGASLDRDRRSFTLEDHLDAIDGLLASLGRSHGPLVVAGHSLGGALGLCIAARHVDRAAGVLTWGAPLHHNARSARAHVRAMGRVNALVGLDTMLAQTTCRLVCPRPRIARPVYRAVRPTLPIPVLEGAMAHSWWSYIGAMRSIVLDTPWQHAIGHLIEADVPVHLVAGEHDRVVDQNLMHEWTRRSSTVQFTLVPDAGHELPIVDPKRCVRQLLSVITDPAGSPHQVTQRYRSRP